MPHTVQAPGGWRSTPANAGWAVRRNSFTKAILVPGLSASSRLSASL